MWSDLVSFVSSCPCELVEFWDKFGSEKGDLIVGTRLGPLVSDSPSSPLVPVQTYRLWWIYQSRFVVAKSLSVMSLSIMLPPVLPIPEPKRLTIG